MLPLDVNATSSGISTFTHVIPYDVEPMLDYRASIAYISRCWGLHSIDQQICIPTKSFTHENSRDIA
jgi:hypothetical protein